MEDYIQYPKVDGYSGIPFSFGYMSSFEIRSADNALLAWKGIEYQYVKIPEKLRIILLICHVIHWLDITLKN